MSTHVRSSLVSKCLIIWSNVIPIAVTPGAIEPTLDAAPFLPPVLNKRSNKGECEWNNIQLGKAPPRFPPFVALDEEERKTRARQQKQGMENLINISIIVLYDFWGTVKATPHECLIRTGLL